MNICIKTLCILIRKTDRKNSTKNGRFFPLRWCAGYRRWHINKSMHLAFISIHHWFGLVSCTKRTGFSLFYGVLSSSASSEIVLHVTGGDLHSAKDFNIYALAQGGFPFTTATCKLHRKQFLFSPGWQRTERVFCIIPCKIYSLYIYIYLYVYTHTIIYMPVICEWRMADFNFFKDTDHRSRCLISTFRSCK